MIHLFHQLIDSHFDFSCLEDQLELEYEFSSEKEKIMYIEYVISQFKKDPISYWMMVIREFIFAHEYDDNRDLGKLSSEKLIFNQTPYGIKLEIYLNDFVRQCEVLLKLYKRQLQTKAKSEGLTISQIAIIHFYNGIQITRDNGNEIAKQYNHTSGEKLFQQYSFYSSATNRKGKPTPCTPKKLKNKIELFESILIHLNDSAKQRANDEIKILKTIYENEYQ